MKKITALCLILLLATILVGIHHFHNHKDIHVHHDCPVFQWESTFVAMYVLLFCFLVSLTKQYINDPDTYGQVYFVPRRGYNRRAPPLSHS